MSDENLEGFKRALHEVLDERRRTDEETHKEHHDWIREEIERRKRKRDDWEKIKNQIVGWSIIAFLGSVAGTVGYAAKKFIEEIK